MKKSINQKKNGNKKTIITIVISLFFILFFSTAMIRSNRNFIFPENIFKGLISFINKNVTIKKCGNCKINDNIINTKITSLEKENNELKKNLGLKESNSSLIATCVTSDMQKTWEGKILIDKGFNSNIKKKMPVISPEGLVGFISKASKDVSEVSLITTADESNPVLVKIEDENGYLTGVISGYDMDKNSFIVTDVVTKSKIKTDSIVMANLNGKNGIFVGKVTDYKSDDYDLTKTVFVKSDVNFNDLQLLMVMGD